MGREKKQLSQYSCGDGTHGCSWMWEWKSKEERNCGSLTSRKYMQHRQHLVSFIPVVCGESTFG